MYVRSGDSLAEFKSTLGMESRTPEMKLSGVKSIVLGHLYRNCTWFSRRVGVLMNNIRRGSIAMFAPVFECMSAVRSDI